MFKKYSSAASAAVPRAEPASTATPEPSSLLLLSTGLAMVCLGCQKTISVRNSLTRVAHPLVLNVLKIYWFRTREAHLRMTLRARKKNHVGHFDGALSVSRFCVLAIPACLNLLNAQTNTLSGNPVVTTAPLGVETSKPWAPLTIGGQQALGVNVLRTIRLVDFDFNGLSNADPSQSGALYRIDLRPGLPMHSWSTRSAGQALPATFEDVKMVLTEAGNVGIGTIDPAAKLDVSGSIRVAGAGNGIAFPDGSFQTSASMRGPQGPQGQQGQKGDTGASGPPVHTSAICKSNLANGYVSSGCSGRTVSFNSVAGGSCSVTADTGSCNAGGSISVTGQTTYAVCSVCAP